MFEEGAVDTIGRKMGVKTTTGAPKSSQAPVWATHVGQTPEGAYHWLSNETPVETDDSEQYFPLATKTEFTGYMGQRNKAGVVEPITMLGEASDDVADQDAPVEKSFGMGDTRSRNELQTQVKGLSDKVLQKWAGSNPGKFGSKLAKIQHQMVQDEMNLRQLSPLTKKQGAVTKAVKKGLKSLKRGAQGWDKNYSTPGKMVDKHQNYDTDTLKDLSDFHTGMDSDRYAHSPHGLQQKLIKRNLRKRGERDFSKYMDEAEGQQFGVYPTGGSIGRASPKPYKTFDNKPDAQEYAKRMRKQLTKGEKGYYKMGYVVKPIKSVNEEQLDEGVVQDVFSFLWNATGKVLDSLPVIGTDRKDARRTAELEQQYNDFVAQMDDATVNEWIDGMIQKLKSVHPASIKASSRRVELLRKRINRVKESKDVHQFGSRMQDMRRALSDLRKFIKTSNQGVADRKKKGSSVRKFQKDLSSESVNEAEAGHSEAVTQVLMRLQAAGGKVYDKAILQKGDETAMLAQNGNVRFAIFQDGTVKRAKQYIDFQRDGWEIEMNLGEASEGKSTHRKSKYDTTTSCPDCGGELEQGYRATTPVKRCKKCGWEVKGQVREAIVQDGEDIIDDETGYVYKPDEVEKGEDGQYREKQNPQPSVNDIDDLQSWMTGKFDDDDDDDDGYDIVDAFRSELNPGQKEQAQGMFGDIAAGGGDPIDYLMTNLEMDMEAIDALAKENGYNDANEWAESYTNHEMESIIRNSKKLNQI